MQTIHAFRDLAHNAVAFILISIFAFCCCPTTMVSGDEKSLASKVPCFLAVTQVYLIRSLSFRDHLQDVFALH